MSYTFPNIAIPDKDKDETYYKSWAQSVCNSTFDGNWALQYNKTRMLFSFFLDGTGNDLTGYLQTAADGSAMPGIWTSQNTVKTKIRSLVGEMEERSYLIKARALNAEAQSRKLEERERLRVKRKLQTLRQDVEDESGIPLDSPEYVPQSDEELREYMDLTWKDKNVLILEGALKWISARYHGDEVRKRLAYYQFIAGISPVRHDWDCGVSYPDDVEPWKFGFDQSASDDMLSDASYFYEIDYKPLADIAQRYNLNEKELNESYSRYQGMSADQRISDANFGCMPGQIISWYKDQEGPRGLVLKIVWKDYKTISYKHEVKTEYGAEYFQDVTEDVPRERDKDKVHSRRIITWRQATLIGGQFLREWGECPNQARDLSTLQMSKPPYEVWINEFFDGNYRGMAEQLIGLQTLKDIALYQLQIQMARAVGKVLVFDEAMMPEGQSRETTLRYLKSDGIVFVNSKEYQNTTGNLNLFKEYDLGMSQSISQAVQIVAYFDQQMDIVSGVSPERTGQIQGSSTSTGTTNAALIQSTMTTAPYFKGFERFWSRVLQQQARNVKLAWAGKEVFAPIIGDVGVDFLRDNVDISLDEYDVVVQSLPPSPIDKQILIKWLDFAVQADPDFLSDAMSIMLEPDLTVAAREFTRKTKLRRRLLAQQAQQDQEAQAQAAEADRAHEMNLAQMGYQNEQQVQAQKDQGGLKKTLATGRVRLNEQKLKLLDR